MKNIDLREYQLESVAALRRNIHEKVVNQILSAPTGSGKTVIAAHLLEECYKKMKRGIFVADRIALIDQTSETLDTYGIPHGIIQGNHWRFRPWERIQIASAQTLAKRGWPESDLIIVDECHGLNNTVIEQITGRKTICIGLSATPLTKALGKYYDSVVTVTTTNKLTREKFLVPFRIFAASEPDMNGVKTVAGEWSDNDAAEKAMPIIGDVVVEYLKHGQDKKFIAFGCNVAHCEEMQRQFAAAGVICELYTYRTGDEARTEIVKEFRKPESYIRGLISVSALSKGFDVSDVEVIIMARPLKSSLSEHIQILGRGLRIHPGKEFAIVLDHSGNMVRFWDDMHHFLEFGVTELDDGKKKEKKAAKKKERKAVKCPKCFHVHDAMPSCPVCGHMYKQSNSIVHEEGTLKELDTAATAASMEKKRDWYAQLLGIAQERGYNHGWAFHKYKEKFKVEPKMAKPDPVMASLEVSNWVRSRQIAFAKAKKHA